MSDVELPPRTPEEKARMARRFFETLDAALLQRGEPKGATVAAVSPLARAQGEHRRHQPSHERGTALKAR